MHDAKFTTGDAYNKCKSKVAPKYDQTEDRSGRFKPVDVKILAGQTLC